MQPSHGCRSPTRHCRAPHWTAPLRHLSHSLLFCHAPYGHTSQSIRPTARVQHRRRGGLRPRGGRGRRGARRAQIRLVGTGLVIKVPDGLLSGHRRAQQHAAEARPRRRQRRRRHRLGLLRADRRDQDSGAERHRRAGHGQTRRPPRPGMVLPAPRVEFEESIAPHRRAADSAVRALVRSRRTGHETRCRSSADRQFVIAEFATATSDR